MGRERRRKEEKQQNSVFHLVQRLGAFGVKKWTTTAIDRTCQRNNSKRVNSLVSTPTPAVAVPVHSAECCPSSKARRRPFLLCCSPFCSQTSSNKMYLEERRLWTYPSTAAKASTRTPGIHNTRENVVWQSQHWNKWKLPVIEGESLRPLKSLCFMKCGSCALPCSPICMYNYNPSAQDLYCKILPGKILSAYVYLNFYSETEIIFIPLHVL
ncbi:uncharacterized protein LOC134548052 [Prinia subflava]|uniref:uncharacterized protein LOC134548052 n=1 Tax=Prinia subflava TaxID=208062 RepID=UPI002FE3466F